MKNRMACMIVWEFRVASGMGKPFGQAYGADGEWTGCFQQDRAHIRMDLLRDTRAADGT
jgi:hypothetical protein